MTPRAEVAEDYADVITQVVQAHLDGGAVAAEQAIATIAISSLAPPLVRRSRRAMPGTAGAVIGPIEPRPGVLARETVQLLRRDHFRCRYCGRRLIPYFLLKLLSTLHPVEFPYHANWAAGKIHPAWWCHCPEIDHIYPGSLGGSWTAFRNRVAACAECNMAKGNLTLEQAGMRIVPTLADAWDGLIALYGPLWVCSGRTGGPEHRRWIALFEEDLATAEDPLPISDE